MPTWGTDIVEYWLLVWGWFPYTGFVGWLVGWLGLLSARKCWQMIYCGKCQSTNKLSCHFGCVHCPWLWN